MKNFPKSNSKSQQGMVLLVTLIMIGIMSIIAVSAIRGSSMQEAMAGNLHDRNMAFQAAEAGLRYAEEDVVKNGFDGSKKGYLTDQNISVSGAVSAWTSEKWESDSIPLEKKHFSVEFPTYPRYVIEKIETGGSSVVYRITSRAFGLTSGSEVIVQSTYEVSDIVPAP